MLAVANACSKLWHNTLASDPNMHVATYVARHHGHPEYETANSYFYF